MCIREARVFPLIFSFILAIVLDVSAQSSNTYTVLERIGPVKPTVERIDVTLLHDGKKLHLACNNYKAGPGDEVEACNLRVGQTVKCQFYPDPMAKEAEGYDYICGDDRKDGRLITSAKNELLEVERGEQEYLLAQAEPFVHHYVGSPCGIWGKESCDEPEMRYTLVGGMARIIVHCQSWDERNLCGSLQVGTAYHCHVIAADQFSGQVLSCIGAGEMGIDHSVLKSPRGKQ
jgi:hypothetical protein